MKKIHVDEILKKKDENLPGPERYGMKDTFGANANSTSYSLRKQLGAFDRHLGREKKLPGPGSYIHAETVGTRMMSSTFVSSKQSTIPKAGDRFRPPNVPKV